MWGPISLAKPGSAHDSVKGASLPVNAIGIHTSCCWVIDVHRHSRNPSSHNNVTCSHSFFEQFAAQGAPWLRVFLEPVVRTINYAVGVLGYKRIVIMMAGLSGGGWSTVMLSAIDPRIALAIPIAGSLPCDFQHTSWDFEQYCIHPRDKAIVAVLLEELRMKNALSRDDIDALPFNTMREW